MRETETERRQTDRQTDRVLDSNDQFGFICAGVTILSDEKRNAA